MQITLQVPRSPLSFLIGFNILLFVAITLLAFIAGPTAFDALYTRLLIAFGALNSVSVTMFGEVWRMVASIFLHVDILHIAFNMFALFQLGKVIELYYGGKLLFAFYMICGIGGSFFSILFLDPRIPTVGASGAVFGLLGVLVAGSVKRNTYGLDLPFRLADILPLVIYAFVFGLLPNSGVNNFAHLGGFITGLALGWLVTHQLTTWRSRTQANLEKVLVWASVAILAFTYVAVSISVIGLFFVS